MTYKKFMSLFLLAGSIVSTLCSCAATDSSAVVGYVDEHPITMEEFNYFLSQQKSSVCQSYSQLYGITSFDSAFWNSEYGDSTPLDSARASAKEACLEAYATQMLAEKTTSAEFLSFSQLKENAENFNTARKESTSNGGIVYGPIEYSFDSYYHRYLSQLENDIKEYWISTNAVSDADIDAFYSENQNLFSLNGDADVSAIYLSYIPSDLSADNIFLGLEEGVSLEDIQTQYPYVTDWHTYSFTNETEKSDLLSHADIVSQASSMNTGDVSDPFLDGTYPCIIKVTRKEDATVIPLAEVRNRITDYLLNSRISTETELIQNRLVWLEFNLGSEQTFNSVTITENIVPNWASERITGLEFQAWNGTEYTTISTYSGTIGTSKTISLPETTSSKFKVLITGLQEDTTKNSKGQTDPSIQEIELYYR